jgi:hypothetical protein
MCRCKAKGLCFLQQECDNWLFVNPATGCCMSSALIKVLKVLTSPSPVSRLQRRDDVAGSLLRHV